MTMGWMMAVCGGAVSGATGGHFFVSHTRLGKNPRFRTPSAFRQHPWPLSASFAATRLRTTLPPVSKAGPPIPGTRV